MRVLISVLLLVALAAPQLFSQTLDTEVKDFDGRAKRILVEGEIVTTGTYYSLPFTLSGFIDDVGGTYPISISYAVDTSDYSSTSPEIDSVSIILQGTFDETNYATVDTLSLTLGTTSRTKSSLDYNNLKYPFYRWKIVGLGSNTAAYVYLNAYVYRRGH